MCRNIRPLFNFEPPATEDEINNASLQFVRKVSGFSKPSQANKEVINKAVREISSIVKSLINDLITKTKPRSREIEAAKAKLRFEKKKFTVTSNMGGIRCSFAFSLEILVKSLIRSH